MTRVAARLSRLLARAGPPEPALPDLARATAYWVGAAVTATALEDQATAEALARLAGYVSERAASVPADAEPHWRARPARRTLEFLAAGGDPELPRLVARAQACARQAPTWQRCNPWSRQFDPTSPVLCAAMRLAFGPAVLRALGVPAPTPETQEDL